MIRVIIADDLSIIRDGLKVIIDQNPDLTVVGLAENGRAAYELCLNLKPDVVLMDIVMPDSDGIEGTRLIKEHMAQIKILILTTFHDSENITKALKSGADGYILKNIESQDLAIAIRNVHSGLKVMDEKAYDCLLDLMESDTERKSKECSSTVKFNLTERELELIRLIVYGKNNKEIAEVLYLSEGRVRNALSAIFEKLELKDRTQLAVFAVKNNIV